MTDSTPGGFADTPGADATTEQDADVRSLLAFLRDEPVEMPPEVETRLYAVLAEERRSAAAIAGGRAATAADEASSAAGGWTAAVTVLPVRSERRGPSLRVVKVVGGLAAAAVVAVGAVNLLGGLNLSAGSSSAGAASSSAGSVAGAAAEGAGGQAAVTASGTAYAKSTLATQVLALTAAARTPAAVGTADATPAPAASSPALGTASTRVANPPAGTAYRSAAQTLSAPGAAAACVNRLTAGETSHAVAIDAGTFAGKPALVVVVPTSGDPSTLDVFVVPLDCSPSIRDFERVPAS